MANKPKGIKFLKEDKRSIGTMVDRLDGQQAEWSIGLMVDRPDGRQTQWLIGLMVNRLDGQYA